MEDQQEVTQASETSRGLDIQESQDVCIEVDESLRRNHLVEQMNLVEFYPDQIQTSAPQIKKVTSMLRQNEIFKKYFEPKMVAIGPLHHENPELQAAEKIKSRLAVFFIGTNGIDKNKLYSDTLDNIDNLKEFYDKEEIKKYNNEELARIFLVDGCVLLHFIDCVVNRASVKLPMATIHILCMNEDLFLVENQLPCKLLELLMSSSGRKDDLKKSIARFIYKNSVAVVKNKGITELEEFDSLSIIPTVINFELMHCNYLLEHLRQTLLQHYPSKVSQSIKIRRQLLKECLPFLRVKRDRIKNSIRDWHSFPTANELKAKGIQLEPCKSSCLLDISFSSGLFSGKLMLPPIVLDEAAVIKFLNVIAYEMFPDFENDLEVTSYMRFIASFIAHEEDVQELRSAGILYNRFGTDEEVRRLSYEVVTNLIPNPGAYEEVENKIKVFFAHRKRVKIAAWVADVKKEYFRNPWTVIAVIAAAFAILVSVVQTYYTIFPLPDKCNDTN